MFNIGDMVIVKKDSPNFRITKVGDVGVITEIVNMKHKSYSVDFGSRISTILGKHLSLVKDKPEFEIGDKVGIRSGRVSEIEWFQEIAECEGYVTKKFNSVFYNINFKGTEYTFLSSYLYLIEKSQKEKTSHYVIDESTEEILSYFYSYDEALNFAKNIDNENLSIYRKVAQIYHETETKKVTKVIEL